ncbi:TIGR00266 family protein [Longilinea arvoryzae]|uniref:TIGR00266 family protein n=1 Tax=Longilinea arvoryzae TaxID=360412 RepID=A0A0S7BM43_9CHLR|nr:TIGR00266 family protein [Longilinea arvoryzae]GAP15025.1 TIGR00266 family protein [Longilinea arvoryzae]
MQIEILYRPSYSVARVSLDSNETIRTESGAMVGMSAGVSIETKMQGGLLKSLARSVLGGESFFINTFHAGPTGGELLLAPSLPGDVFTLELQNEAFLVQSGSFLASSEGIETDTKWSGARTFFGGEGLIMLRCSGKGTLALSSFGAIHEMELAAGQTYTVDTGHLVAFTEQIGFRVRAIGGVKSTLFGGEGLVVDLTGPGRVLLQTRSQGAFLDWLLPKIPKQSSNNQ